MKAFHSLLVVIAAGLVLSPTRSVAQADDVLAPAPPPSALPVPAPGYPQRPGEPAPRDARNRNDNFNEAADRLTQAVRAQIASANRMALPFGESGKGSRILLVQQHALDAATASTLEEDMSIMSRILQKTVERLGGGRESDKALGIVLSSLPGSRSPQSIYLEGYGALFLLNVRFPLFASGDSPDEETQRPADSAWEEARREVLGHHSAFAPEPFGKPRTGLRYDPDQVEALKKDLLAALKDASNLRGLKPEEFITVVVSSGGDRSGAFFHAALPDETQFELNELSARFTDQHPQVVAQKAKIERLKKQIDSNAEEIEETREVNPPGNVPPEETENRRKDVKRKVVRPTPPRAGAAGKAGSSRNERAGAPQSTLTLRIKKSDAESLAAGKLDSTEFVKRALVTVY